MERTCDTCGADIAHRGARARFCVACSDERKSKRDREHNKRASEARKSKRNVQAKAPQPQVIEPASPPQNVPHHVPSALRVSVLDAGDDESEVDFAALVVDVLGLSLNRRELLRALLDEVSP